MNLSRSLFLCTLLAAAGPALAANHDDDQPKPKGILSHLHNPFRAKDYDPSNDPKPVWNGLALGIKLDPAAIKISETRSVKVTVDLVNKGKKLAQMEFPTTQRIEVIVRDTAGHMLEQWSEDQSFTDTPGIISINPGERVEYSATVSTRAMKPEEKYIVEAFFPKYDQLKAQKVIMPGK